MQCIASLPMQFMQVAQRLPGPLSEMIGGTTEGVRWLFPAGVPVQPAGLSTAAAWPCCDGPEGTLPGGLPPSASAAEADDAIARLCRAADDWCGCGNILLGTCWTPVCCWEVCGAATLGELEFCKGGGCGCDCRCSEALGIAARESLSTGGNSSTILIGGSCRRSSQLSPGKWESSMSLSQSRPKSGVPVGRDSESSSPKTAVPGG